MHVSTSTTEGKITLHFYRDFYHDDPDELYELITQYLILYPTKKPVERYSKNNYIPLRKSLFPNVAPYVEFQLHWKEGLNIPSDLDQYFQWDLTPVTPVIVQRILKNTGYRLTRGSANWRGTWCEATYAFAYKGLKSFQKLNHFPGSYEIGHKDRLCRNINRLVAVHGRKEFNFVPRTYLLPQDYELLCAAWGKSRRTKWILKPPASSRGHGIRLINRWTQIPRRRSYVIVQRYLSRPKLMDGQKFDLRLYVLITSFDPLRIYLYQNGLVRLACTKYKNSISTLHDHFMHLTNYSVNRHCSNYVSNDDVDSCKGHKWSLKCLWNRLKEQGADTSLLLRQIDDMLVKTLISGEPVINSFSRVYVASSYNCFELLGVDVLLDEDLKPWLLEVNISPSLHTPSALDEAVKGPLTRDVLNLACYQIPVNAVEPNGTVLKRRRGRSRRDFELHAKRLTDAEKLKQQRFACVQPPDDYLDGILRDLTPDDARQLIRYEDELARLGDFRKIFPTRDTRRYFRYFGNTSYYNRLLDAWETVHDGDRARGISRLRQLCASKYHLLR